MSTRVLAHVRRLWLRGVARSARGCVGFVEVWHWGNLISGNVSDVFLNFCQCF